MKKIIIFIISLVLSHCSIQSVQAKELLKNWEFRSEVIAPEPIKTVAAVPLAQEVYDASNVGQTDLRLVDEQDEVYPYLIKNQFELLKRQGKSAKVLLAQTTPNETVMVADVGEHPNTYKEIELTPKDENFVRRIILEGSDDQVNWNIIRKDILVYSFSSVESWRYIERYTHEIYSGYSTSWHRCNNMSFRFPEQKYRYLKVTIPHGQDKEPVELKGMEVFSVNEVSAIEMNYDGKISSQKVDEESKSQEIIVDLSYKNLPIYQIDIITSQKNYMRNIEVHVSNDGKEWTSAGSHAINSISLDDISSGNHVVKLHNVEGRYLKLTILNGDNKPLDITSIQVTGLQNYLVFLPEKGKKYFLAYGNPKAKQVSYDLGQVLQNTLLPQTDKASLGQKKRAPYYEPQKGPWTEDKPYLLWGTMIAIIGCLLFMVSRVLQHIDTKL